MINKKNVLGKVPDELGTKDAIHTAIVSVRAACAIEPGQKCSRNEHGEFKPDDSGVGVADPFRKTTITRGKPFWLLLAQDEVPNVVHHWDHPTVDFTPPTREVVLNRTIKAYADELGITYDELMSACEYVVHRDRPAKFPGEPKTWEEAQELEEKIDNIDSHELWPEWAGETNYEFANVGSECCPEYEYPTCSLFEVKQKE